MIVAGFGFRQAACLESLQDAYEKARGTLIPDGLATVDDKAASAVFQAFAHALALPVFTVSGHMLHLQDTVTCSAASQSARATGSVAEAAALAGAGPGARLVAPRHISTDHMATCALAIREIS